MSLASDAQELQEIIAQLEKQSSELKEQRSTVFSEWLSNELDSMPAIIKESIDTERTELNDDFHALDEAIADLKKRAESYEVASATSKRYEEIREAVRAATQKANEARERFNG